MEQPSSAIKRPATSQHDNNPCSPAPRLQLDVVGRAGAPHRQLRRQRQAVLCRKQGRAGRGGDGGAAPDVTGWVSCPHAAPRQLPRAPPSARTFHVRPLAADGVDCNLPCDGQVAVPRLGPRIEEYDLRTTGGRQPDRGCRQLRSSALAPRCCTGCSQAPTEDAPAMPGPPIAGWGVLHQIPGTCPPCSARHAARAHRAVVECNHVARLQRHALHSRQR